MNGFSKVGRLLHLARKAPTPSGNPNGVRILEESAKVVRELESATVGLLILLVLCSFLAIGLLEFGILP
jgi:hypothetical protein